MLPSAEWAKQQGATRILSNDSGALAVVVAVSFAGGGGGYSFRGLGAILLLWLLRLFLGLPV